MAAQVSLPLTEELDEDNEPIGEEEVWCPEPEPFVDFVEVERKREALADIPYVMPSQFTEFAFRMPRDDGFGYEKFKFDGRRHMVRPYDTPAKRMLLFCARQVEKSTLL